MFVIIACSGSFDLSNNEPVQEAESEEPGETAPADIAEQSLSVQESAPPIDDETESSVPTGTVIPAADKLAVPDCNAFDRTQFDSIVGGTFEFITQDQLNNCHFESDNGFRMLIGGGKPSSSTEIESVFNSTFGALPDSTWEAVDNYYLGLAFSSVSVTVQGVSSSGHTIVVAAASEPVDNSDALQQTFNLLGRNAAHQLNAQW